MPKFKNHTDFLESLSTDHLEVAQKVDKLIRGIEPEITSNSAWLGWGYKRGDNYSCVLTGYKDHLKLMIFRGVDLNDPSQVLEGTGSNTRHIKYSSVDGVEKQELEELLLQQFALYDSGVRWE